VSGVRRLVGESLRDGLADGVSCQMSVYGFEERSGGV
jgi:hypothetical protein